MYIYTHIWYKIYIYIYIVDMYMLMYIYIYICIHAPLAAPTVARMRAGAEARGEDLNAALLERPLSAKGFQEICSLKITKHAHC